MDIRLIVSSEDAPPRSSTSIPPPIGILTRTLIYSPVMRWILPARIRHRDKNDVVFIRDNSVEIKEFNHDHLTEVVWKADEAGTIRCARILGAAPLPIAKSEPGYGPNMANRERTESPDAMAIDSHVSPKLPPQVLVMTLHSGREDSLVFHFAFYDDCGHLRFMSHYRRFPREACASKRLGAHLAVDPNARAVAIAAHENNLIIYSIKSRQQLRSELRDHTIPIPNRFNPIDKVLTSRIEGVILKMEFLYPTKREENIVILQLVVSIQGQTKLKLYHWDSRGMLSKDRMEESALHPVGVNEQSPLFLIPFMISTSFSLVTETSIHIYRDVLSGYQQPLSRDFNNPEQKDDKGNLREMPGEPGNSRNVPIYTAWTRPVRRPEWAEKNETIYLCREDGLIRLWDLTKGSTVDGHVWIGRIPINIDTAIAALDNGIGGYQTDHNKDGEDSFDMLVAAGDMSDGGLFKFVPRLNGYQRQSITSWTPVLDYAMVPPGDRTRGANPKHSDNNCIFQEKPRIFAGTGRGANHGAISEMRHGVEAQLSARVSIPANTSGMWILPHSSGSGVHILLSSLDGQSLLCHLRDDPSLDLDAQATTDITDYSIDSLIIRDECTLAAAKTATDIMIQVSDSSMRAIFLSPEEEQTPLVLSFSDGRILKAYIETVSSSVLVARQQGHATLLQCKKFALNKDEVSFQKTEAWDIGQACLLTGEVSCLFMQAIGNQIFAFVGMSPGTSAGSLKVYRVERVGLSLLHEYNFGGDQAICESVSILVDSPSLDQSPDFLIVCGLRNGKVQVVEATFRSSSRNESSNCTTLDIQHRDSFNIGTTSVSVMPDTSKCTDKTTCSTDAIVICESIVFRLRYAFGITGWSKPIVNRIWFTDQNNPGLGQPCISGSAQLYSSAVRGRASASTVTFFCIEGYNILVSRLDSFSEPRVIPRRIFIGGTPNRIVYSPRLDKLIVAYTTIQVKEPPAIDGSRRCVKKRLQFPTLEFIGPDEDNAAKFGEAGPSKTAKLPPPTRLLPGRQPKIVGKSGEMILGLMEWELTSDGSQYNLLVVATQRQRSPTAKTGAIRLFSASATLGGVVTLTLKHSIKRSDPVYSITAFGSDSLLFGSGADLVLLTMSSEKRFVEVCSYSMRSPATRLSVHGNFVYASTFQDSVLVFQIENGVIYPRFSDIKARAGLHHLFIPSNSLTLASSRDGTLTGFSQPSDHKLHQSLHTQFEAHFPASVTQLRQLPLLQSRPPPKSTAQPILASFSDGAFRRLDILDEPTWRFLRFVQNLIEREPDLSPFTYGEAQRGIEPVLSGGRRHYLQVNGDVLARLLTGGKAPAEERLRAMLERESTITTDGYVEWNLERRLEELANAVDVGEIYTGVIDLVSKFVDTTW